MTLIEYFGLVVKPKIAKGKYMFDPLANQQINENIYALRDKDVNAFIYKKGDDMIAIDCGYKNCANISNAINELGLDESTVTDLFLTHLDLDHAGGVDKRCSRVFPNAQIYLGKVEEGYLKRKLHRKKIALIGLKTPIKLDKGYSLLKDGQTVTIGSIEIQAILVPGHTMGHLCYLIDKKFLFTGDSIILVHGEGYAFYKLWNVNTKINIDSLKKLGQISEIEMSITSHSGFSSDWNAVFAHTSTTPDYKAKGFKVSEDAPFNPYE